MVITNRFISFTEADYAQEQREIRNIEFQELKDRIKVQDVIIKSLKVHVNGQDVELNRQDLQLKHQDNQLKRQEIELIRQDDKINTINKRHENNIKRMTLIDLIETTKLFQTRYLLKRFSNQCELLPSQNCNCNRI